MLVTGAPIDPLEVAVSVQPDALPGNGATDHRYRKPGGTPDLQFAATGRRQGEEQHVVVATTQHPLQALHLRPVRKRGRAGQIRRPDLESQATFGRQVARLSEQTVRDIDTGAGNQCQFKPEVALRLRTPETLPQIVEIGRRQAFRQITLLHDGQTCGPIS